jgi:hypothetical protein
VNVVGHEAICQEPHIRIGLIVPKQCQISQTVRGRSEHGTPIDAPLCDVASDTGQQTSIAAWHSEMQWPSQNGDLRKIAQFRLTRFPRFPDAISGGKWPRIRKAVNRVDDSPLALGRVDEDYVKQL